MATLAQQQAFWLADWQVKPDLGVIEKAGETISLEPKVMAVLVVLASRPGDVFSRQELEEQVWQGTVVGYDALAKAINKLREALGDNKKDPQYIQTLSKKGYRLVAAVSHGAPGQPSHSNRGDATAKHKIKIGNNPLNIRRRVRVGIVLSVFIIAGLLLVYQSTQDPDQARLRHTAQVQDTKPTVVVMPFRNISPSDKDDYLADGLTSDLTTNLSKLSSLWVTASAATLVYKNTEVTPETLKQDLNARYVISGEVNRIGQAIRINVHLTDLESRTILWADRYDRQFTDLFAIQDEVTRNILNSLSLTLTKEEKRRIAKRYTNNLEAYETFLRGQFLITARTPEDNTNAREMFAKAIKLDPGFARAYAGMSYSYAIGYLRQWPSDTDQPLRTALQLADKAIELDKDLPEGYWAAAFVYFYRENLTKGTELLQHALKLNPNYADVYALLAANYISGGKPEEALDIMVHAYRLNPTGGYLYDMQLARANYFLGNYELALKYLTQAIERNPTFIDLQMYMAATYIQLDRYDDAGWMILEAKQSNPDFDPRAWAMSYPFLDKQGFRAKLLKDIKQAEDVIKK